MINLNHILGYENLYVFQDSNFFSFSLDSIILANYTTIRLRDKKIIDFCTGNAVVPLILSRRTNKCIEGIELQTVIYNLAIKSINYNNLNKQIKVYNEDVKSFCSIADNQSKYDLVLCNPPYFKINNKCKTNLCMEKTIARHEIMINLADICSCAKKILKDNGCFSLIHRTDRLMEILELLRQNNLEPKSIKFIYESIDCSSNLILIQSQKNGKVGLKVEAPLILFNKDGSITDEYSRLQTEVFNDTKEL